MSPTLQAEFTAQCFVMAGGQGTRLQPLTEHTPKPLLPLGESARLIDPVIVECAQVASSLLLASGDFVGITQYVENSHQVPFQPATENGYRGHGYVLAQNQRAIEADPSNHLVVTPADHLRNFDLQAVLTRHEETEADLTVVSKQLRGAELAGHDVLDTGLYGEVRGFKPQKADVRHSEGGECISLGTYIFRKDALLPIVRKIEQLFPGFCDIGHHILPKFFAHYAVGSFAVANSWADMGTISSYHQSNMLLVEGAENVTFSGASVRRLEHDGRRNLVAVSATVPHTAYVDHSVICGNTTIGSGAVIENTVLGFDAVVGEGVRLHNAIVGPSAQVLLGDQPSKVAGEITIFIGGYR